MKSLWIYLDDKRKDPTISHNSERGLGLAFGKSNQWIIARNYHEFVELLKSNFGLIDFISFDHDISSYDVDGKELTGKDAANFLINMCLDNNHQLPDWFVHSDNTAGNKNIRQLLTNYMFKVEGRLDHTIDSYGFYKDKFYLNP
jgi:hypothetical protein